MKRLIASKFLAVLTSPAGDDGAYLRHKPELPPLSMAQNVLLKPIGSLPSEINTVAEDDA